MDRRMLRTICTVSMLLAIVALGVADASIARGVVFDDRDGDGVRAADEPGIAGVGVSNGRDVALTDDSGRWQLTVEDADTIFVIKPRGWRTAMDENGCWSGYYVHRRRGSPALQYGGVEPTGALPRSIDFPLYRQDEPDRFKALIFGDPQVTTPWEVELLARDVIGPIVTEGSEAVVSVSLGDMANNYLDMLPPLVDVMGKLGMPNFYLPGNHDENYDASSDRWSLETWSRVMGPEYYSLDWGPVHFIVLDDVVWHPATAEEKGRYTAGIHEEQMEFIRNDLALVPKDRLVVYMFHIPLPGLANRAEFLALFEGRPNVLGLSAHTHTQYHLFFGSDAGWWSDEQPHHHLVHVTSCGSWWRGPLDEHGIPATPCRDGVPNGYSEISFDGNRYSIEYIPARRPRSYQVEIFAPTAVTADVAAAHRVYANVFAGSSRSIVEMRIDGGEWQAMVQEGMPTEEDVAFYTTCFEESLKGLRREAKAVPPHVPTGSPHLWHESLPAGLTPGYHAIEVRTTDMFGQTYSATRLFRID